MAQKTPLTTLSTAALDTWALRLLSGTLSALRGGLGRFDRGRDTLHANYLKALQEAAERTLSVPALAHPKGADYWASGRRGLVWNQGETIVLAAEALLDCVTSHLQAREIDSQLTIDRHAEYLAHNCYELHAAASQYLEAHGVAHDLVLGDVLVNGAPHYDASVDGLLRAAALPLDAAGRVAGHCWLTLEDGTILDATLRAALSDASAQQSAWSLADLIHVATWDPEKGAARLVLDLVGMSAARVEYLPMLIGAELTRSVGGMPPAEPFRAK